MVVTTFQSSFHLHSQHHVNAQRNGSFPKLAGKDFKSCVSKQSLEINFRIVKTLQNSSHRYSLMLPSSLSLKPRQNLKKTPKSWFTDECKQAINARKEALRRFNPRPTSDNLSQFRISRAKARLTIKNSKRKSWRQYVSKLNSRTSSKKVWDMIRKINSKCSSPINHLNVNNEELDTSRDIADALASTFAKKSSPENYSEQFQRNKGKEEKKKLSFKSNNTEHYNKLFTIKELKTALEKAHDSCPGSDKVHYQFLKHLPFTSISILLDIFNDVWQSGDFPSSWKEA